MMKSLKAMLKQDKEKYTVPKSVHDYIPITAIWEDGIFKVGNKFAKTFKFSDINYLVAGIPTFLDRVIQQCLKIVIEPIVEAGFYPQSYGFRPYRSTKDAVHEMFNLANSKLKQKAYFCIEGDIQGFFDVRP